MNKLIFLICISFLASCASSNVTINLKPRNSKELTQNIKKIFADSSFLNAHWGVLIKSLKTGKTLYAQNEDRLFNPASNTKIVTTAATLLELGPDFQFKTILYTDGIIQDSVLMGNLYVKGDGDPTLYERFYHKSTDVFTSWSKILKLKGIKTIQGSLIGDLSAFNDERIGNGWSFNDLDAWYSAEFSPLQFNENYVDVQVIPPINSHDSTLFIPNITSDYFKIIDKTSLIDTGKSKISVSRDYGTNNLVFSGFIRKDSNPFMRSPSIDKPALFYLTVLKEQFELNGIHTNGSISTFSDTLISEELSPRITELYTHYSAPGLEILKELMKRSQNLFAETMPRKVALNRTKQANFEKGSEIISERLQEMGIPKETYQYYDGSGLSRYNYFSPNQFVHILEYMYRSDLKYQWLEILPIAGVDGTLKARMKETLAQGNVRAKTGTISNVRALSGYVTAKNGEVYVFSFLVNGHLKSSSETDRITDSALISIAAYDGN